MAARIQGLLELADGEHAAAAASFGEVRISFRFYQYTYWWGNAGAGWTIVPCQGCVHCQLRRLCRCFMPTVDRRKTTVKSVRFVSFRRQ